jgi:Tol biopolymer transport system component
MTGQWRWLIAGAVLFAAIVLTIDVRRQLLGTPSVAFDSKSLAPLTTDAGLTTEPSISADGRLVAYASNRNGEGGLDIWVQQVTGGAANRVAADPTDDHQPNLSPDGSLVAFRSERNGGGVYVVSPLGGEARLVAAGGMAPRFSPDGRTIAFWTGGWLAPRSINNVRRTFIVPAAGGEPRQLGSQLAAAGDPIWAPDGRSLLVFARTAISGAGTNPDWWWIPLDSGSPIRTGAYASFAAAGIEVDVTDTQPYPGDWTSSGVLFAARVKGSEVDRIWRIAVDPRTGHATEEPVEITAGTTIDSGPAVSRDGRLIFAAANLRYMVLGVPLDANRGKPLGAQKILREDVAPIRRTGMSDDGRLLVFPLYNFGTGGIWLKDLVSGRERQLVATPPVPLNPVMSPSGKWVAYTVTTIDEGGNAGPGAGYVIATSEGTPRKVCDECQIYQWTRDDGALILLEGSPFRATLLTLKTRQHAVVLSDPGVIDRPILSPDGRWISFGSANAEKLAPFRPGTNTAPEAIPILPLHGAERGAGWSPDGRLLYLLLENDGFRCLYAVSIDPATGGATGKPSAVYHFHDTSRRWGSTGYGNAVTPGWFLSNQFAFTGNIWMGILKP